MNPDCPDRVQSSPSTKERNRARGVVAVVTGANSGLGLETAKGLADRGYHVVMASRNLDRSAKVADKMRGEDNSRRLTLMHLDLGDLKSVEQFSRRIFEEHSRVDLLCNNAGVMGWPRAATAQGFEMHMGINHIGHFALTGRLMPLLIRAEAARVIVISSLSHKWGKIELNTLGCELDRSHPETDNFDSMAAYAASKLANLMFAFELDRRLRQVKSSVISVAAHPGYAWTGLGTAGARASGSRVKERLFEFGNRLLAQPAKKGAEATLHAAISTELRGGEYIGPDGLLEMRGRPRQVRSARRARNPQTAALVWARSVGCTGVDFDGL